jgi:predicted PurR-regulated permease PerM
MLWFARSVPGPLGADDRNNGMTVFPLKTKLTFPGLRKLLLPLRPRIPQQEQEDQRSDYPGREPGGVVIKYVVMAATVFLAAYLVWGLRSLIVPIFVGGLLAYICRPLVARLERYRIPRGLAIGLLLLMFAFVALATVNSLRAVMPSETAVLDLRVRALYALNHRYRTLMGLDPSWTRGNRLYQLAHRDLDPLVDRVSELLALTPDERAQFVASREWATDGASARSNRLLDDERANTQTLKMRARRTGRVEPAPIPFGEPAAVPNRLFEPALAVLADVDEAVGDYVRGMFLECCALGLTVMVFFTVVGVPLRWAIAIGTFVGATNVVPYMGFAAALLSGLGYALLAEDVHPLLTLVTAETFAMWVVVAVVLAELLKNVVYEPIILGRAVKLHPLIIVIGVVGGAILFGPAGMLLAVPTITVAKVLVASSARHLTAYGLI